MASTRSSKFLAILPRILGGLALASWLLSVMLGLQYDRTRPTMAQTNEGRVYPFSNHNHIVYLTSEEKLKWDVLVGSAICLFVIGIMLDQIERRKQT